jgi:hypothetical protein
VGIVDEAGGSAQNARGAATQAEAQCEVFAVDLRRLPLRALSGRTALQFYSFRQRCR